jgi:branched-chain amino acid transport system substrate-binding protein
VEETYMKRGLLLIAVLIVAGGLVAAPALAQDVVKLGQIEAQTGPNAIYGWMSSQGTALAVDEINKAGGFKVGNKTYKIQLIALDTRGEPKEATVQLKRLVEVDQAKYIFGPFLSNVFLAVRPYAAEFNGKLLMWGGATRIHDFVGTPGNEFLMRTWNWDAGKNGFGELMVDNLVKTTGAKKIAMLFQNDQGGKVLEDIYVPMFKQKGIESRLDYFEPGTKDFSAVLAKIAAWKPDFLFPGYADSYIYDIVRQATETGQLTKFFLVRGSLGPGLKNKDGVDEYMVYVPKYFEEAEKKDPKVAKFVKAYKDFYKRDFPYDQAPLCSSSCYDHVYMLVEAMKKAGTVDDPAAVKKALLSMTYDGLWKIRFDEKGEAVFNFDVVRLKKGGALEVHHINPN